MLYFVKFALKNVFRQRLRSMLCIFAISIAVMAVMAGMTMSKGMEKHIFSMLVGESGELVVARQDYFDKARLNPLKYSLKDANTLQKKLLQIEGIKSATLRIDFGVMLSYNENNEGVRCTAVDVEQFAKHSSIIQALTTDSHYLKPLEKSILIGKWTADKLQIKIGDKITLLGKSSYDSMFADDFIVAGIYDLGSKAANKSAIMPIAQAQYFLEMDESASKILIFTGDHKKADLIAERIKNKNILKKDESLRTWKEDAFLSTFYSVIYAVRIASSGIICFVAALGILNMMIVTILERRKEIGLLMALGMSHIGIVWTFFCEALFYGLFGSTAGLMLGFPISYYLSHVGINLPVNNIEGVPFALKEGILYGNLEAENAIIAVIIGIMLSVLGMSLPVVKTFSMGPQDAMRHN